MPYIMKIASKGSEESYALRSKQEGREMAKKLLEDGQASLVRIVLMDECCCAPINMTSYRKTESGIKEEYVEWKNCD